MFLKILIHSDAGNENEKKDNPAGDDMRPMLGHTRAEIIGQDKDGGQPTDTGKKRNGDR